MYHRPLGCSESNYATCLQLIREDGINCIDSVVIKVAPLSSDNEDVFGQPRHSVEAVRAAAVPVSTMEVAVAMATTLPASRIVRQSVSTQEGQADKKTQTPALFPWM